MGTWFWTEYKTKQPANFTAPAENPAPKGAQTDPLAWYTCPELIERVVKNILHKTPNKWTAKNVTIRNNESHEDMRKKQIYVVNQSFYTMIAVKAQSTHVTGVHFEVLDNDLAFFPKSTWALQVRIRTSMNVLHPTTSLINTGAGPKLVNDAHQGLQRKSVMYWLDSLKLPTAMKGSANLLGLILLVVQIGHLKDLQWFGII